MNSEALTTRRGYRRFAMACLFLATVCVLCNRVSTAAVVGAQLSDRRLLSEDDVGYQTLESLQRTYCATATRFRCDELRSTCVSRVTNMWRELFHEEANAEALSLSCDRISTRFEIPGAYRLLTERFDPLRSAALDLGFKVPAGIRLGTLPLTSVSASAYPRDQREIQLIIVNLEFLTFANELAKASARAIPVETKGDGLIVDRSDEAFTALLKSDPTILRIFHDRVAEFANLATPRDPVRPADFIQPILSVYTDGIETFALAHELGHVLNGHTSAAHALENGDAANAVKRLEQSTEESNWVEEAEADVTGLRLSAAVFAKKAAASDAHMLSAALPECVDFYFLVRDITLQARHLWSNIGPAPNVRTGEEEALSYVFECASRGGCDISDYLASKKVALRGHPSPLIRRALVRRLMKLDQLEKSGSPMIDLAILLRRNAEAMWNLTKSDVPR